MKSSKHIRKVVKSKRSKYVSYYLSSKIDIPMAYGKFRVVTTKKYITRRQWFNTKGRLYMKCLCYNGFVSTSKFGGRKKIIGKRTINIVSAEYPNISRHKRLVQYLCYNRASYSHLQKGGKSNPIIEVMDWIIKYPSMYSDVKKVPYLSFKTVRDRKGVRNVVYKNMLYNQGSVRFMTYAESDYVKPVDTFAMFSKDFSSFLDNYYVGETW